MRWVKPEVFLIAKTGIENNAVRSWLNSLNVSAESMTRYVPNSIQAEFTVHKTDAERTVELAGRRCYLAFEPGLNPNVTKIREDIAEYCENILKQKHGSVLEHVTFTFAIEGVSRVFTGEMNRHRAGVAISEGSMRYIRFTDIPVVETPMLTPWPSTATTEDELLHDKIERTRVAFVKAFAVQEEVYAELQEIWKAELEPKSLFKKKKDITSMMRRVVGMGVATGGIWTMNVRALRHIVTMRADEPAEEEIAVVAGKILEIMMKEEPSFFGDFKPNERGYWRPKYEKV